MQSWSRCSFTTYKIERLLLHAVMYLHANTDLQLLRVTEIPLDWWFPELFNEPVQRGNTIFYRGLFNCFFFSMRKGDKDWRKNMSVKYQVNKNFYTIDL